MLKILLTLAVGLLQIIDSAKILGVFPVPSYSHQQIFLNLAKELSFRGHEITLITPNPLRNKSLINITEIDISHLYKLTLNEGFVDVLQAGNSMWRAMHGLRYIFDQMAPTVLETKEVQDLLKSRKKFDLVIVESHDPIFFSFGPKFNSPVIGKSHNHLNMSLLTLITSEVSNN